MKKGIDVSHHQGSIDWNIVKSQIDFAIIRCGYGDNIKQQDDRKFETNFTECEKLGIPKGIYTYIRTPEIRHRLKAKHNTVVKGDNLTKIARKYGTTLKNWLD